MMSAPVLALPFTAWSAWYESPANLAHLYRWLDDRGQSPSDVAGFLEEPWHWCAEWTEMCALGAGPR